MGLAAFPTMGELAQDGLGGVSRGGLMRVALGAASPRRADVLIGVSAAVVVLSALFGVGLWT
jgi:hypothetical protein